MVDLDHFFPKYVPWNSISKKIFVKKCFGANRHTIFLPYGYIMWKILCTNLLRVFSSTQHSSIIMLIHKSNLSTITLHVIPSRRFRKYIRVVWSSKRLFTKETCSIYLYHYFPSYSDYRTIFFS